MLLTLADWEDYNTIINEALGDFSSKTMQWLRKISQLDRYMEDTGDRGNMLQPPVDIPVLCNYNWIRSWPINRISDSGELALQTIQIIIQQKWLKEHDYLTPQGFFNYSADDRFIIDGLLYKSFGDTLVSQSNTDLIFSLILRREETLTGY